MIIVYNVRIKVNYNKSDKYIIRGRKIIKEVKR